MSGEYKQVIGIRRDLKMRRGKECAQSGHAASMWLRDRVAIDKIVMTPGERGWFFNGWTKVVVQVHSLEEVQDIVAKALTFGLPAHIVWDSGRTEFHGEKTATCFAIGPGPVETIDKVTGHLELY